MTAGPSTVGELAGLLRRFPADTPIQFTSTDGPDYGWLVVGGEWKGGYLYGGDVIANPESGI